MKMTKKKIIALVALLLITLLNFYFLKQHRPAVQTISSAPSVAQSTNAQTKEPSPELNENLKDTLNLYLNSSAPYKTEERTEKENDLLMKLSSEIENRIDLPTFIYTFEHSAPDRKCLKKENDYECFARVEKSSGWKIILSSPAKDQLHFEKISWESL
jgi:hypothetical protein